MVNISTTQTVVNNAGVPGLSEMTPLLKCCAIFNPGNTSKGVSDPFAWFRFHCQRDGYILTNTHVVGNADEKSWSS